MDLAKLFLNDFLYDLLVWYGTGVKTQRRRGVVEAGSEVSESSTQMPRFHDFHLRYILQIAKFFH